MINMLLFLLFSSFVNAEVAYNKENCNPELSSELKLKVKDLKWGQSLNEMTMLFDQIYKSGKRLEYRAYKDGGNFVLPTKDNQKMIISDNFINNLSAHIESALQRHYVDFIFFSDMGHAHLFVDKKLYQESVKTIPPGNKHLRSEVMLNNSSTKFLYHTAEQLKTLGKDKLPIKDKKTQWRFFSRNLVGQNLKNAPLEVIYNQADAHNSVRGKTYDINGEYKYWGSGFDFSASKNGCFIYKHKGQKYNYDISLYAVQ